MLKAMQARVAICNDTQTEHVINGQSLGIGRVNHILRVHGHELSRVGGAALHAFDTAGKEAMDRLFLGMTVGTHDQTTLAAALSGLGWRRASEQAQLANLAAFVMAKPKVGSMSRDAVRAGLLREGQIEHLLENQMQAAQADFMQGLDELERVCAEAFLRQTQQAADEQWERVQASVRAGGVRAPNADTSYVGADGQAQTVPKGEVDGGTADIENSNRRLAAPHLQKELARLQDCTRLQALETRPRAQGNWQQLDRLK